MCCGNKYDTIGKTVNGLVAAGDADVGHNDRRARENYEYALRILQTQGGCNSCINQVQQKLNRVYQENYEQIEPELLHQWLNSFS